VLSLQLLCYFFLRSGSPHQAPLWVVQRYDSDSDVRWLRRVRRRWKWMSSVVSAVTRQYVSLLALLRCNKMPVLITPRCFGLIAGLIWFVRKSQCETHWCLWPPWTCHALQVSLDDPRTPSGSVFRHMPAWRILGIWRVRMAPFFPLSV
jgi:hypothetical protein